MSQLKAQAVVYATLGDYASLKNFVETKLLLTPIDLWEIFKSLPQDLSHQDQQSKIKAIQVARCIVKHPNLAPEQVLFFLDHKKQCLKHWALIHPNFPPQILKNLVQELINDNQGAKLNKVLENPAVGPEFVDQILDKCLWRDEDVFVNTRHYLCKHASTAKHFTLLHSLNELAVKDNMALLKNPNTSEELLTNLSDYFWHYEEFYNHPKVSFNLKQKALRFVKQHVPHLYNKFEALAIKGAAENLTKVS